jgi:hypothetical protein
VHIIKSRASITDFITESKYPVRVRHLIGKQISVPFDPDQAFGEGLTSAGSPPSPEPSIVHIIKEKCRTTGSVAPPTAAVMKSNRVPEKQSGRMMPASDARMMPASDARMMPASAEAAEAAPNEG